MNPKWHGVYSMGEADYMTAEQLAALDVEFARINSGRPMVALSTPRSLPKPPRVEKWQRWRSPIREYVVRRDCGYGRWDFAGSDGGMYSFGEKFLLMGDTAIGWHFLGYAKPDKIEVGQRWQSAAKIPMRVKWIDGDVVMFEAHGFRDCDESASIMLTTRAYEYLGMADDADPLLAPDVRAAMIEAVDAFIDKQNEERMALNLVRGFLALLAQWVTWCNDPRLQNELAAKRLIANPPTWAYPRAWTCAVLAVLERHGSKDDAVACFNDHGSGYMYIGLYHNLRLKGQGHEKAKAGCKAPACNFILDAYARGMEKPAGLMPRPRKHYGDDVRAVVRMR